MENSTWTCPRCGEDNRTARDFAGQPTKEQRCSTCQLEVDVDFAPPRQAPPPAPTPEPPSVLPEAKTPAAYLKELRSGSQYDAARLIGQIIAFVVGSLPVFMFVGRQMQPEDSRADLGLLGIAAAVLWGLALAIHQASAVVFDIADTLLDIGRKDRK